MENGEETLVGGQAVMEGVMMRAPHSYCVAVRKPDGEIVTEEMPLARISDTHKIFKLPVFRGVGTLFQAMKLGVKALRFSTNAALDDPTIPAEQRIGENSRLGHRRPAAVFPASRSCSSTSSCRCSWLRGWRRYTPCCRGGWLFNLTDGVIRIAIFLAFLYALSRMKDIRRMFEYHGAEHKVVFNFESGQPVNVANAQKFSTFHPRCGTSFLFVMMILAMPVYALIPFDNFAAKFVCRIVLLPLIVGVSYELIRFAAKRRGSFLATVTAPGLWLQRITTKQPADDQAAIAIRALEGAMALEESQGGELVIA